MEDFNVLSAVKLYTKLKSDSSKKPLSEKNERVNHT